MGRNGYYLKKKGRIEMEKKTRSGEKLFGVTLGSGSLLWEGQCFGSCGTNLLRLISEGNDKSMKKRFCASSGE